jgi:predicted DNA-binding helix-hairpin-helix protein
MRKDIFEKMEILADSAKYDVSCSSSGSDNNYKTGQIGATHKSGICHTFTADGRCVSLLKVLLTNYCIYDCAYCINRKSNEIKRAAFAPRELADITINFYKRNYIEGLFLSSGIIDSEDHTMNLLLRTLKICQVQTKNAPICSAKVHHLVTPIC